MFGLLPLILFVTIFDNFKKPPKQQKFKKKKIKRSKVKAAKYLFQTGTKYV